MASPFYQPPKHPIKRIKSAEKYPSQQSMLALPSSMMADQNSISHNFLVPSQNISQKPLVVPSIIKDCLFNLQSNNAHLKQNEKKAIALPSPSFSSKYNKNSAVDIFKECQEKINKELNNKRKESFMKTDEEYKFNKNLSKAQNSQVGSNPQLHPSVRSLKIFSESVSTDSSGKRGGSQIKLTEFEIGKKLGTGKYGQVFIVKHKRSGMVFALKKIYKADISEDLKTQLIHEIKIQMFLDHPNIVKLYAFFSDEEYLYLLTQLCTSGHLYELLKNINNLPETNTKIVMKQLCQGIDYLHQNNIMHRDLKLQNILFQFGMVKICDFGWSTVSQTLRDTFCGTPLYISPELLQHQSYSNKVDIWSIGVLGYQLLFGKVPFQIRNRKDFNKIVQDQLEFPPFPQVSKEAKSFIKGCLIKNPDSRTEISKLIDHEFLDSCETINCQHLY